MSYTTKKTTTGKKYPKRNYNNTNNKLDLCNNYWDYCDSRSNCNSFAEVVEKSKDCNGGCGSNTPGYRFENASLELIYEEGGGEDYTFEDFYHMAHVEDTEIAFNKMKYNLHGYRKGYERFKKKVAELQKGQEDFKKKVAELQKGQEDFKKQVSKLQRKINNT
mgnify:CR=1 FL=1